MRKRALAALLLAAAAAAAFSACEHVEPGVIGTPTPSASPTPMPDPYTAEITAAPLPTDLLGAEITSDDHYLQYLSFGDVRVYEYDDGTFFDGICVNAFPYALDGEIEIVYYDAATGKVCGQGVLHNASGTTLLVSGSSAVYAEISTDIDVRMMDFSLVVQRALAPVPNTTP